MRRSWPAAKALIDDARRRGSRRPAVRSRRVSDRPTRPGSQATVLQQDVAVVGRHSADLFDDHGDRLVALLDPSPGSPPRVAHTSMIHLGIAWADRLAC